MTVTEQLAIAAGVVVALVLVKGVVVRLMVGDENTYRSKNRDSE